MKKVCNLSWVHLMLFVFALQFSVLVHLSSQEPIDLEVSYQVYNVGWEPSYDARGSSDLDKVQLEYSGEDTQSLLSFFHQRLWGRRE